MRLVSYSSKRKAENIGVMIDDAHVLDIARANMLSGYDEDAAHINMLSLIEAGQDALDKVTQLLDACPQEAVQQLSEIRLLAPISRPPQIRDFICFESHLRQGFSNAVEVRAQADTNPDAKRKELIASGKFDIPKVWYEQPIYYKCNRFSVSGPNDVVVWPHYSNVMDFELEFAAVIGKQGKDIKKGDAGDYIFGLTIFNDFSARDAQTIEMEGMLGPAKGKDFDGGNALGPCIVTLDEIGDPYNLKASVRVNDVEWSQSHTADMHWRFEDLIEFVSRSETIYPGEILGSGTLTNGCGVELKKFLQDGDVVELEFEKIGVLKSTVIKS